MQLMRFINGGFVLHKIREGDGVAKYKGVISAWYDREGGLLDCQQVLEPFGRIRTIRKGGPIHRYLVELGNRYKHIPAE